MSREPIHLPALAAKLGDWTYYTTLMRLGDVADRIEYASEVAEMRPNRQLSDLIQRALKEGRPVEIGRYLVNEPDHFFNSLVVGVYGGDPEWMEFDITPNAATRSPKARIEVPTWARSAFGYLHLSGNETLFALDGQHRLAGVKLAVTEKQELADECLSVIFVSHRTTDAGRRRTRRLFTTLNKTAVAVNKSEIIALDESDVGAILTRRLVENHPYFCNGQVLTRYGSTNLSAKDAEHFLTIIKLYDVVLYLLGYVLNKFDGEQRAKLKFVRPSDADLNRQYAKVVDFLERFIKAIPELSEYFEARGDAAKQLIRRERFANRNVLFRSVGLEIFLRLIHTLKEREGGVRPAIHSLIILPRRFTDIPYKNVLYSISEERILSGRTLLTARLLLHMLGLKDKDHSGLVKAYAEALGIEPATTKLPEQLPGKAPSVRPRFVQGRAPSRSTR